ncbi:MAG: isochorismatase family protein [Planctomycetes bacterium]|nr:isochorismatase family protein [Planctomycetota bacterium]
MPLSLLITQCLQRDFVGPLGPHDPIPNTLHVGPAEAERLFGGDPRAGPIAQLMTWARAQPADALAILHVRDDHDLDDPRQAEHLRAFGAHCLRGSAGAAPVLGIEDEPAARANEEVLCSIGLSDFAGTDLEARLRALRARAPDGELRVGVVGVWTEAKVTFLLYELKTRCGLDALATSSALTASASRTQHFNALEQLRRILGVQTFDSVGEFVQWLSPGCAAPRPPALPGGARPRRAPARGGGAITLSPEDAELLGYLHRDSARVELTPLAGGFSGALVFRVDGRDAFGQEQAPSVTKLGERRDLAAERVAFEHVESSLGNSAPRVHGFVELGDRAGIRYAYASMGRGDVRTLRSLFESGCPQQRLDALLSTVFEEVLGRLYAAAQLERLPLLAAYELESHRGPYVRAHVERLVGTAVAARERLSFGGEFEARNLCAFYEDFLPRPRPMGGEFHYVSYVHGDLNASNVLLDAHDNVWVIDFSHAKRGHVLRDLARLENDVQYLLTPLADEAQFAEALRITRALREVQDLRAPLPEAAPDVRSPALLRAWSTIRTLRGIAARLCREDRHPLQMNVALLRIAAAALCYEEVPALSRRWALAAACGHAEDVRAAYEPNPAPPTEPRP